MLKCIMHIHKQYSLSDKDYICVFIESHVHQIVSLFLISSVKHLTETLEWVINVLCLKSAHFEEFKADTLGKSQTVLGTHGNSVFDVNFVGNDNSHKWTALIVLLDSL